MVMTRYWRDSHLSAGSLPRSSTPQKTRKRTHRDEPPSPSQAAWGVRRLANCCVDFLPAELPGSEALWSLRNACYKTGSCPIDALFSCRL
jgi:hypothetical protein